MIDEFGSKFSPKISSFEEVDKQPNKTCDTESTFSAEYLDEPSSNKSVLKSELLTCFRKTRWKATPMEKKILRENFWIQPYPSQAQKVQIKNQLKAQANSKISIKQICRWFQHYREKQKKLGSDMDLKDWYKKFSKTDKLVLQENFEKNPYPTKEEFEAIAQQLSTSCASKVENWYKYHRRFLCKKGLFEMKTRKFFSKVEKESLKLYYASNNKPSTAQIQALADKFQCHIIHVRNWFSNQRKKEKQKTKKNCEDICKKIKTKDETQELFAPMINLPNNNIFLAPAKPQTYASWNSPAISYNQNPYQIPYYNPFPSSNNLCGAFSHMPSHKVIEFDFNKINYCQEHYYPNYMIDPRSVQHQFQYGSSYPMN